MQPIHEVRLWVGLTPLQMAGLQTDSGAEPSAPGRFGMRLDAIGALQRAHWFDEESYDPKELAAMQVQIITHEFFAFPFLYYWYVFFVLNFVFLICLTHCRISHFRFSHL